MQQIAKQIKHLRLQKNLKQKAVADAIGLSLTAYSNIECGKTINLTVQRLIQIANALQTDAYIILKDTCSLDKDI